MSSTTGSSIMISQRVIELWPAQDFITMGDNFRMQSVRVVTSECSQLELSFLNVTPLLNVLYLLVKYHENNL